MRWATLSQARSGCPIYDLKFQINRYWLSLNQYSDGIVPFHVSVWSAAKWYLLCWPILVSDTEKFYWTCFYVFLALIAKVYCALPGILVPHWSCMFVNLGPRSKSLITTMVSRLTSSKKIWSCLSEYLVWLNLLERLFH